MRLSQLEGVDSAIYAETVLPRVLEQVANCKDTLAQSYLMDCIIHVFPDEFHLPTLEAFLQTCTQLKEKVTWPNKPCRPPRPSFSYCACFAVR